MRILFGLILGFGFAGSAHAGGAYVAIGGDVGTLGTQRPTGDYSGAALSGRLGYDIWDYFGIEVEGAVSLSGEAAFQDRDVFLNRDYSANFSSRYGLFLRGRLPVSESVTLFARTGLGVRQDRRKFRSFGVNEFDNSVFDETSVSKNGDLTGGIGGGVEVNLSKDMRNAVRAEFTRYGVATAEDNDNLTDSVVSISYVRRF